MTVSDSSAQRFEQIDPDVRLMLQVRDDNAAAFEELVSRYQNRLITVLEHLMGRRDQAEDLAQEVFLRVYRARKRYVAGARFSTWLFTITNNVASNAQRSRSRRREVNLAATSPDGSGEPLDYLAAASSGAMPSQRMDHAERAQVVRSAMESLNERQRMALLLCKFEGMSYSDIAEAMGLTPQAVKSLLSRARTNLRSLLAPYMDHGTLPSDANQNDAGGNCQPTMSNEIERTPSASDSDIATTGTV